MTPNPPDSTLEDSISTPLRAFVDAVHSACGADLVSAVRFASAAEDRLRRTSDGNLMLVLRRFDPATTLAVNEAYVLARASIQLTTMWVLEAELTEAVAAFDVKFADMFRRRRVLFGSDPLAQVEVPRGAIVQRLQQVLLNLVLRLREAYVGRSR